MEKRTETIRMKNMRLKVLDESRESLLSLGYKLLSKKSILQIVKRLGLDISKKKMRYLSKQEIYQCSSPNGYQVTVTTSLINDFFMENGRVWVMITQDERRLWTRYFMKNHGYALVFKKIVAYAEFARNIVDNRPLCPKSDAFMDLLEEKKSCLIKGELKDFFIHRWVSDHADYRFTEFWKSYVKDMSKENVDIILSKESKMKYYFEHRTAKRFARNIRKKPKITKPQNSVAKR